MEIDLLLLIIYFFSEKSINEADCKKYECIWSPSNQSHVPWCYLDINKVGYNVQGTVNKQANGLAATLIVNPEAHKSLPFTPISQLKLEVNYLTERIFRIRIIDPVHKRYEVPIQYSEFNIPNQHPANTNYEVTLKEKFDLVVRRKDTGTKMYVALVLICCVHNNNVLWLFFV